MCAYRVLWGWILQASKSSCECYAQMKSEFSFLGHQSNDLARPGQAKLSQANSIFQAQAALLALINLLIVTLLNFVRMTMHGTMLLSYLRRLSCKTGAYSMPYSEELMRRSIAISFYSCEYETVLLVFLYVYFRHASVYLIPCRLSLIFSLCRPKIITPREGTKK